MNVVSVVLQASDISGSNEILLVGVIDNVSESESELFLVEDSLVERKFLVKPRKI